MKLNKRNWKEVEYGQVVDHIEINERDPEKRANAKYVSVQHLHTLDLRIKGISPEEQPTFSRTFKKGQILFAKRRAYQKKVAIADFDGICSPHLWALESKGELLQELLPFIMQRDEFYKYVNANSAGTMSSYLKWPALSKYKFKLPSQHEQEIIITILQNLENQIYQTESQEINLRSLAKKITDDFVDSFLFGNRLVNVPYKEFKWKDCVNKIDRNIDPVIEGVKKRIGGENIESSDYKIRSYGNVEKDYTGPAFIKRVIPNDILYVSRNPHLRKVAFSEFQGVCANTTFVIRSKENILSQELLKHIMISESFSRFAMSMARGSTNPYINWKDLNDYVFKLPELKIQNEVSGLLDSIINLAELSRQQLVDLKNLKMKLLDELLG